jgi:hypothetical protein
VRAPERTVGGERQSAMIPTYPPVYSEPANKGPKPSKASWLGRPGSAISPRRGSSSRSRPRLTPPPQALVVLALRLGQDDRLQRGRRLWHRHPAHAQATGPDGRAAWQRIERRIADAAPVVPLTTRRTALITSRRAGNIQFHPVNGVFLDQVWVRYPRHPGSDSTSCGFAR